MVRSTITLLLAVMVLCACVDAACAKNPRARQPAAHRSGPAAGQALPRKKPPVAHTPSTDEKSWMERTSAPSSSGGIGM